MRSSRMIFAGTVIAAAVASGTAMTNANVVPNSVAGYGEGYVSGAKATAISYNADTVDSTVLASVDFTITEDITNQVQGGKVTMMLKTGADPNNGLSGGTRVGGPYVCAVHVAHDTTNMIVRCSTTSDQPRFDDFTSVGLTVIQ